MLLPQQMTEVAVVTLQSPSQMSINNTTTLGCLQALRPSCHPTNSVTEGEKLREKN